MKLDKRIHLPVHGLTVFLFLVLASTGLRAEHQVFYAGFNQSPAGIRSGSAGWDYAEVIKVKPLIQRVRVSSPRQECWQEQVAYEDRRGYRADNAPVLGAILGGAFGHAAGHGKKNKDVGTFLGAVLGASIASSVSARNDPQSTVRYVTEERCRVVEDWHDEERLMGYLVDYSYNGQVFRTRMDTDPGKKLKIRLSVEPVM